MSKQNVGQTTEMYWRLNVTVPHHIPDIFIDEYLMEMESALMAKADEVAKKWEGKVELNRDNEQRNDTE